MMDLWYQLTYASRHHFNDTDYSYIRIFQIQIHTGFNFTYIHSNNSQIHYNIQIHCMYTLSYSQKLNSTSTIYRESFIMTKLRELR
jgi:hypothetical protein